MNRPTPSVSLAIDELDEQIHIVSSALVETRALKESQLNGHLPITAHPLVLSLYMLSQDNGSNLLSYRKALARMVYDLIEEKRRFMQNLELSQKMHNNGSSSSVHTMMMPPGYGETTAKDNQRLSRNIF